LINFFKFQKEFRISNIEKKPFISFNSSCKINYKEIKEKNSKLVKAIAHVLRVPTPNPKPS